MRVMDNASQAVLALTNRIVDVGERPLKASEFWSLIGAVGDPSRLAGMSVSEITAELAGTRLDPERIAILLDTGLALATQLETLREKGIWALTRFDPAYPAVLEERLGVAAPPVLYGAGKQDLLNTQGIGVVGSRDVSEEGAEVARNAARKSATVGLSVVSGAARGVDQLAMDAALDAGGTVVGVLAESLERAISVARTRSALIDGQMCLVTPYHPSARFSVGNAMGRNKIIYALSRVTLVVATAEGSGGTWSGATEAMNKLYGRVAVWRGEAQGSGNEALQRLGAASITSLDALFDVPDVEAPRHERVIQLSLTGEDTIA